jgi:HSP20 family molecular chaperone IbpA
VKDKVLTLTAEAKAIAGQSGEQVRLTERKFGVFLRVIPLPSNVATHAKVEAELENGALAIAVPKGTPSVNKSIVIN